MDIEILKSMVSEALFALDGYESTGDSNNDVFKKIRAVGDVCIENDDIHPELKKLIDIRKQYDFKTFAFSLRRLSSLSAGRNANPQIRKYLNSIKSVYIELSNKENASIKIQSEKKNLVQQSNKVFIVHGHDDLTKLETARFIANAGLEAIILHEQPSASKTIIEKIESYGDVGFAVILYTPCDVGSKNTEPPELKNRARQNVVFEHGYFIGRLGRDRVSALVKGAMETPNDISGVVYIDIDSKGAWKMELFKELENAGYKVNTKALR